MTRLFWARASRLVVFAIAVVTSGGARSGDSWSSIEDGRLMCNYAGEIKPADVPEFRTLVRQRCKQVNVASVGGDVNAAIAMGRLLRENTQTIVIPKGYKCASACVFIYAGGVARLPFGPVEIHRPYLETATRTSEETRDLYSRFERSARQYLRDMNVQDRLFDLMMSVPPEDSRGLALDEMESLGMGAMDPVQAEYEENLLAARAGMTRAEWLRRKRAAIAACGPWTGVVLLSHEVQPRKACWSKMFPQAIIGG